MKRIALLSVVVGYLGLMNVMAADSLKVTVTNSSGSACDLAMWITTAANVFQESFGSWGGDLGQHAKSWNAAKGSNTTVDGITGATISNGSSVTSTWKCRTSSTGTTVPSATYRYWIELCRNADGHTTGHTEVAWGAIACDGVAKNRTGSDSTFGSSTTAIGNITVTYKPMTVSVFSPEVRKALNPLAFTVPAGFSGTATVKLLSTNGRVLWSKTYTAVSGNAVVVDKSELQGVRFSGVCLLVADYGSKQIVRSYLGIR